MHHATLPIAASSLLALLPHALLAQPLPPAPAGVQVTTQHGIEFATVGARSNVGFPSSTVTWTGDHNERQGRGAVSYDYRISRTEVTTGQWLEFFNTFAPRPMPANVRSALGGINNLYNGPSWWGAAAIADNPLNQTVTYALRTDVPNAGMIPVSGISWRTAAMYCNWLNNNKSSDWSALLSGAYDASTWGVNADGSFTDAITHSANAQFWIPNFDEWTKAAFYDQNRFGPGQGGWWNHVNASDALPMPGFPGTTGTTTSTGIPDNAPFNAALLDIPLAAYREGMSPWGLFDTSGGAVEMVEDPTTTHWSRLTMGAAPGTLGDPSTSQLYLDIATRPFFAGSVTFTGQGDPLVGLRIAGVIPIPGSSCILLAFTGGMCVRPRRT